jgi:hypothetical protein
MPGGVIVKKRDSIVYSDIWLTGCKENGRTPGYISIRGLGLVRASFAGEAYCTAWQIVRVGYGVIAITINHAVIYSHGLRMGKEHKSPLEDILWFRDRAHQRCEAFLKVRLSNSQPPPVNIRRLRHQLPKLTSLNLGVFDEVY